MMRLCSDFPVIDLHTFFVVKMAFVAEIDILQLCVLAGEDRLAVHPVRLTVLEGVVVGPHIEEVADALAAHQDRLRVLVCTPARALLHKIHPFSTW